MLVDAVAAIVVLLVDAVAAIDVLVGRDAVAASCSCPHFAWQSPVIFKALLTLLS